MTAIGAGRAWKNDGLTFRNAVNNDVSKTADERTYNADNDKG